jgi:hypothetical protein
MVHEIRLGRPQVPVAVGAAFRVRRLIDEVLKRPRRSRLAHLRTTGAEFGHDEPHLEVVC